MTLGKEYIMDQRGLNYIEQLKKFTIGDVEALIKSEIDNAGPLLMVVMNGINAFGGVRYGFTGITDKDRCIKFMKNEMRIDDKVAKFLYKSVRCGVVHEGMPVVGITYEVDYKKPEWSTAFRIESQEIILNVVGLANYYKAVVNGLADSDYNDYPQRDVTELRNLLPDVRNWVENAFEQQTSSFISTSTSVPKPSTSSTPSSATHTSVSNTVKPGKSRSGNPSSG